MAYSLDLRKRVIEFVESGGSKAEAHRRYKVSVWCIDDWLRRKADLLPKKPGPQKRWKLDLVALEKAVQENPDAYLQELAETFGTARSTIWYALQALKISRKKNHALPREM